MPITRSLSFGAIRGTISASGDPSPYAHVDAGRFPVPRRELSAIKPIVACVQVVEQRSVTDPATAAAERLAQQQHIYQKIRISYISEMHVEPRVMKIYKQLEASVPEVDEQGAGTGPAATVVQCQASATEESGPTLTRNESRPLISTGETLTGPRLDKRARTLFALSKLENAPA